MEFEERASEWASEKNQLESNALQCTRDMEQMSVDKTRMEAHVETLHVELTSAVEEGKKVTPDLNDFYSVFTLCQPTISPNSRVSLGVNRQSDAAGKDPGRQRARVGKKVTRNDFYPVFTLCRPTISPNSRVFLCFNRPCWCWSLGCRSWRSSSNRARWKSPRCERRSGTNWRP